MADIQFDCPYCKQQLVGPARLAGTTMNCPACNGHFVVPAPVVSRQGAPVMRVDGPGESVPAGAPADEKEAGVFHLHPMAKAYMGRLILGILLTPVLVGLIILFKLWYKVNGLSYRLTTQRLFIGHGLLAEKFDELELYRVKDVTVNQSVLQRMLGYGNLTVLSNDDSNPVLILEGIEDPAAVKETLRDSYRAARKREGVRPTELLAP